jgi:hypothetical protein
MNEWWHRLSARKAVASRIAVAAAAAHLVSVIAGAARLSAPNSSLAGQAFNSYAAYSGANNSYGFFAPGVAAEWRAALDSYDAATGRWTTRIRRPPNVELAVLDSTINSLFANEDLREALAASWAGTEIAEMPNAAAVVVRAQAFLVPAMEHYRAGTQARWVTLAAFAFTTDERMELMSSEGHR